MNFSLFICDEIIYIISLISSSIRQVGEHLFNTKICFSELIINLNSIISKGTDREGRMNIPSTLGCNWRYRCTRNDYNATLAKYIRKITKESNRL
jgi:hypothetical protein